MAKRKNSAAVALGRRGGQKRTAQEGWKKISPEQRKQIARDAAKARWSKERKR